MDNLSKLYNLNPLDPPNGAELNFLSKTQLFWKFTPDRYDVSIISKKPDNIRYKIMNKHNGTLFYATISENSLPKRKKGTIGPISQQDFHNMFSSVDYLLMLEETNKGNCLTYKVANRRTGENFRVLVGINSLENKDNAQQIPVDLFPGQSS